MSLEEYRKEINRIDRDMAKLFEERMQVVQKIGEFKKENGLPVKDAQRENVLAEKCREYIKDPEVEPYYISFLRNNIDLSCKLQEKIIKGMKVGYSGVPGAFAYIAAKRMFPEAELISYPNFGPVYNAAVCGDVDCAVMPIENSYAGDVGAVMDLAFSGNLYVNRISWMEIEHNLIGVEGAQLSDIKTVVSHPQALAQCDEFIKAHGFETREYSNTARAAEFVKTSNDKRVAAVASKDTAEIFGLKLLESCINTSKNNTSRFAVFSRSQNLPDENSPQSAENFMLMFTVPDEAGALAMVLDIIGAHKFNMKNLKSRPMKGLMWRYYFYVEAEGNISSENGQNMLREMSVLCDRLKLVGTYKSE